MDIKTEEFIEHLRANTNATGWANFVIAELPPNVQGRTHNMFPARKTTKDASS